MRNLCTDVESSIVGICISCFYERTINKQITEIDKVYFKCIIENQIIIKNNSLTS